MNLSYEFSTVNLGSFWYTRELCSLVRELEFGSRTTRLVNSLRSPMPPTRARRDVSDVVYWRRAFARLGVCLPSELVPAADESASL